MSSNGLLFSTHSEVSNSATKSVGSVGALASGSDTRCLGRALARVPNELGFRSAAAFRVVVEGKPRELKAGMREEIYRIGREAIANAFLHSRAEDIETDIEYWPTELRIAVRDNGCGIDPHKLRWVQTGRWGLREMRERAEEIGARLQVLSRVASGTEVVLCVPGRTVFEQS